MMNNMTPPNRRNLGSLLVGAGAVALLAGCGVDAAKIENGITTAENDVKTFITTVTTDLPSLATQWGTIKGIGDVAVAALTLTNPTAAMAITAAMGLGDKALAFLTSATTATSISDVQSNVQIVLDNISSIIKNAQGAFDAVEAAA